jgi:hypothetical protein
MDRPSYFDPIQSRSYLRWEQLEHDPELAGPWHQLFKQVQSPRHVLSELLQNADDAGATCASVRVQDDEFIFSHNGEDFSDEHFASLCRFGYSNKRALHTIGFRGVGFKSTFSLGDEVRLFTPTLAVAFNKVRFTAPVWLQNGRVPQDQTEIRVKIKDRHRKLELEKNLDDWFKSPASLLFFRSIRSLRVADRELCWLTQGPGPVKNSQWMSLSTDPDNKYLLVSSSDESFPPEALEEIRQERMLSVDEDIGLPPCRVEIVLGFEGRLFVILPTGVKTQLPFACNAPFVQDPARVKVKDPETSPTNRWLLNRLGQLAGVAMLGWLNSMQPSVEDRCEAYRLFPDVDRDDNSIEGCCATIVENAFWAAVKEKRFLFTENEQLEKWKNCMALPHAILDVWTADQVSQFLAEGRPILNRHITDRNRSKLINWGCCDEFTDSNLFDALETRRLPKPATWRQLLTLWDYVSSGVTGYRYYRKPKTLRIIPVQGKNVLYAPSEVVRLGDKKLLQSQEDWEFLARYLLVANQNWPRYLGEQRRKAEDENDEKLGKEVAAAHAVQSVMGQNEASDVSAVIQQVAKEFFSTGAWDVKECVRLAQLAATLNASTSEDFQFVTRAGHRKPVKDHIMADLTHDLDKFVQDTWYEDHVISEAYGADFKSCTQAEWESWITSGRSGLLTFVPLIQSQNRIWGRTKIQELLKSRGLEGEPYFPYAKSNFIVEDWDFNTEHWKYWESLAKKDDSFWSRVLGRVLKQPREYWQKALSSRVLQIASTNAQKAVTSDPLLPAWIMKLRGLPCIQDTRGFYRQPAEVLRRTGHTESLLDVEPFVRAEFDTEANRPLLVKLGVRDTPTGPDRLLERLAALAQHSAPPVYEVEKWYHRLDQMITSCSTDDFQRIKDAFQLSKIIFTESREWARASEVFLTTDEEDVPGAAVVLASVRHLALWLKIGIANRPTADLALDWLKSLPSGQMLSQDEIRRVRSLLPRYPDRIWNECEHWLNLEGEWVPVSNIAYALTMQSLIPWKHLFRGTKQKTADFQKLPTEICEQQPFSSLKILSQSIDERFQETLFGLPPVQHKEWLAVLAASLRRILLDNETETSRVRDLADRLAQTAWQVAIGLETVPYIDGIPAGTARRIDVLWKDSILYVEDKSAAKMAKAIAQELGRVFAKQEIADAIKLCYDRSPDFVTEYMEENFNLIQLSPEHAPDDETPEDAAQAVAINEVTEDKPQSFEESLDDLDVTQPESEGENTDSDIDVGDEEPTSIHRKTHKGTKIGLLERYARSKGFSRDGEDRFRHPSGNWIEKVSGMKFPWELYSAGGDLLQCYWAKDHCLQKEPLQLPAEIWSLCDQSPGKYSLILSDAAGAPIEISGHKLKKMCDHGELTLHPATYRLVYEGA